MTGALLDLPAEYPRCPHPKRKLLASARKEDAWFGPYEEATYECLACGALLTVWKDA